MSQLVNSPAERADDAFPMPKPPGYVAGAAVRARVAARAEAARRGFTDAEDIALKQGQFGIRVGGPYSPL
jgi:hypothetical protein